MHTGVWHWTGMAHSITEQDNVTGNTGERATAIKTPKRNCEMILFLRFQMRLEQLSCTESALL